MVGGIIILVMGLGLTTILSRTLLADASDSEGWPTTTGTVVTSEIKTQRSGDGNTYSARVIYDYVVDGTEYTSGKITVADGSSSRSAPATRLVEQYPVGSQVDVYYNPLVPDEAVLQPGAPRVLNWLYWGGIAFVILGVWTGLYPLQWERVTINIITGESVGSCHSDRSLAFGIPLIILTVSSA